MNGDKVAKFIRLSGNPVAESFHHGSPAQRQLGAQLLLSEVLEYVVHGLGVTPEFDGMPITAPDRLQYTCTSEPNLTEMLDGLSDVAYTMYWNSITFGAPLEEAFDAVCDNNLQKFIPLPEYSGSVGQISPEHWHCGQSVLWPKEVASVSIVKIDGAYFAVGKDANGKVRKPSTYSPVDLKVFVTNPDQGE
jgi:predicted HAD superfamily Cof-like phosphohydrolase